MLRKVCCAVVILGFSIGLAVAEDIKGKITKIDGQKITVEVKKEAKELDAAKDCKVCKVVEGKEEEVTGGLTGLKVGKGIGAVLTVDGGKVTKIVISGKKKKAAN